MKYDLEVINQLKTRRNELRAELSARQTEFHRIEERLSGQISGINDALDLLEGAAKAPPQTAAEAMPRRGRAPSGAVRQAILAKLDSDFGSMTAEDLAKTTDCKLASVRAALKALEKEGAVTLSGEHWLLSASEKARRQAERKATRPVPMPAPIEMPEKGPELAPVD